MGLSSRPRDVFRNSSMDQRTQVFLQVVGVFTDVGYQRCVEVANTLGNDYVTITVEATGLTETDY